VVVYMALFIEETMRVFRAVESELKAFGTVADFCALPGGTHLPAPASLCQYCPRDESTKRWLAGEEPRGPAPAPPPAATLVADLPRRHGGQLGAHAGARPRAELRQHSLHALQGTGAGGQRRGGDQP